MTGGLELNQLLFDGQVFVGLQARAANDGFCTKECRSNGRNDQNKYL